MSKIECWHCLTIFDKSKHFRKTWFIDEMNNKDERTQIIHKIVPYNVCNNCRDKNRKETEHKLNIERVNKIEEKLPESNKCSSLKNRVKRSIKLRTGECEVCGKIDNFARGRYNNNNGLIHCYGCKEDGLSICYNCHDKIHYNK